MEVSLPYYDQTPDESILSVIDELLDNEEASGSGAPPPVPLDWTPRSKLLAAELDRHSREEKVSAVSLARYDGTEPTSAICVAEYMRNRLDNLALLNMYGRNAWLLHNHQLETLLGSLESELGMVQEQVKQVNKARKNEQINAGQTLDRLESQWKSLIDKIILIQVAIAKKKPTG